MIRRMIAMFAVAALVAACDGAPGDSDAAAAIERQAAQDRAVLGNLFGAFGADAPEGLTPKIHNVAVGDCTEEAGGVYACAVSMTVEMFNTVQESSSVMKFAWIDDEWRAVS